jgi:hypothetical protein
LWKKKPGPFAATHYEPKTVRAETLPLSQYIEIKPWNDHPLWLKIDLKTSLLGSLRSFLYKPPQVRLNIADVNGNTRAFLMPLPMGRTGFIVNPFIDDPSSFMEFADSRSKRLVSTVSVDIAPQDRKFFADSFTYELSELPAPHSGGKYFSSVYANVFHMFRSYPMTYDAHMPVSETDIDGRRVAILHAPSVMTFDMVKDARTVSGQFGFMPGAYTNGGRTNGAEFVVYWSNGSDRVELFHRFLDPLNNVGDRGLQAFEANLSGLTGGRIYLQVKPGPYNDFSWDWTGWTDIQIK